MEKTKVALLQSDQEKAEMISANEINKMVKEAIELAGGFGFINDGETIVIKPNLISTRTIIGTLRTLAMLQTDPYAKKTQVPAEVNGMTADWRVTKAVVEKIREVNPSGKVLIMEMSGEGIMKENFDRLGYTKENMPGVDEFIGLDEAGHHYRDVDDERLVGVDLGDKQKYEKLPDFLNNKYYFDKKYFSADRIISVAALKNHINAAFTGGIKNVGIGAMPGKVYGSNKKSVNRIFTIDHSWDPLARFIHDYYLCKPVDFVVTDGLQGLAYGPQGQGAPSYKAAKMNMRLILAGKDPVAVDTVHATLVGVDPMKVNYLQYVSESTGGENRLENINVLGNRKVDDVKKTFPMKGGLLRLMYPDPNKALATP